MNKTNNKSQQDFEEWAREVSAIIPLDLSKREDNYIHLETNKYLLCWTAAQGAQLLNELFGGYNVTK
jgi:hypothetical protein